MHRKSPWALAAALLLLGAPAGAQPAADRPAAAPAATPSTMHLYQSAYLQAIALQAAVAMGDWAGARAHLDHLERHLAGLDGRAALASGLRDGLTRLRGDLDGLEGALEAQDTALAGRAAFGLVTTFLGTADQLALAGGGGGGAPGDREAALGRATALEHLHAAYEEAAKARLSLARGDLPAARLSLRAAALHLDEAAMARPELGLRQAIAALRPLVDRTAAALDQPVPAARLGNALVMSFSATFEAATARLAGGGAGAGAPIAVPAPGEPAVVGQPPAAEGPGAGDAADAGAAGATGTDEEPAFDDIEQDRPNQRGRQ